MRKQGHEISAIYGRTPGFTLPWDATVFSDETKIDELAAECDGFISCIVDMYACARVRYSRRLLRLGLSPISAIHPTAFFGEDVNLGIGVRAMARGNVNDDHSCGQLMTLAWTTICANRCGFRRDERLDAPDHFVRAMCGPHAPPAGEASDP